MNSPAPLLSVQGKGHEQHGPRGQRADIMHPDAQTGGQHDQGPGPDMTQGRDAAPEQKRKQRGEKYARHRVAVGDAPECSPAHPDGYAHDQAQNGGQNGTAEQPAPQKIKARVKNEDRQGPGPQQAYGILVSRREQGAQITRRIPKRMGMQGRRRIGAETFGMPLPGGDVSIHAEVAVQLRPVGGNLQHARQGGQRVDRNQQQSRYIHRPDAATITHGDLLARGPQTDASVRRLFLRELF